VAKGGVLRRGGRGLVCRSGRGLVRRRGGGVGSRRVGVVEGVVVDGDDMAVVVVDGDALQGTGVVQQIAGGAGQDGTEAGDLGEFELAALGGAVWHDDRDGPVLGSVVAAGEQVDEQVEHLLVVAALVAGLGLAEGGVKAGPDGGDLGEWAGGDQGGFAVGAGVEADPAFGDAGLAAAFGGA